MFLVFLFSFLASTRLDVCKQWDFSGLVCFAFNNDDDDFTFNKHSEINLLDSFYFVDRKRRYFDCFL